MCAFAKLGTAYLDVGFAMPPKVNMEFVNLSANEREEKKHGPVIVRSVGGVTGPCLGPLVGAWPDTKQLAANLVDWYEPLVPLRRKTLDLLEIQNRWIAFANDCHPLAFFGQQRHRSGYRRAQFHRAMICQGD